ncbi:hypothetical protein EVA_12641 [gut metagenome]|uniref:Uncharacterized protein n=1 Tax=gut metagenome TaxID=749906 RepID=J9FW73_9ZZZZ
MLIKLSGRHNLVQKEESGQVGNPRKGSLTGKRRGNLFSLLYSKSVRAGQVFCAS